MLPSFAFPACSTLNADDFPSPLAERLFGAAFTCESVWATTLVHLWRSRPASEHGGLPSEAEGTLEWDQKVVIGASRAHLFVPGFLHIATVGKGLGGLHPAGVQQLSQSATIPVCLSSPSNHKTTKMQQAANVLGIKTLGDAVKFGPSFPSVGSSPIPSK